MDPGEFSSLLEEGRSMPMEQTLINGLCGIARATASELLLACGLNPLLASSEYTHDGIASASMKLTEMFAGFKAGYFFPVVIEKEGEAVDFLPFRGSMPQQERQCESMSVAVESFFCGRDLRERLRQKSSNMLHVLGNALNRSRKKLDKQIEELHASQGLEIYRLKGELLMANLHKVQRGQGTVEVENYYSGDGSVLPIVLNPALSPSENAQAYYKKYAKAKQAKEKLAGQITGTQDEIDYIEGLLQSIDNCSSENELDEIKAELSAQGYLKEQATKTGRKPEISKPLHYRTRGGGDIYVGRNNAQNDFLTMKFARAEDIWMHTRKIPGSHVILRCAGGNAPDDALHAGAMLAAFFSRARASSNVPVDYTQKKNVKKPAGARPGYVIYLTNRTLTVTPDEAFLGSLKAITD